MYKSLFRIQPECIDAAAQEIHTPFTSCFYVHSLMISRNGMNCQEGDDFSILGHKTRWNGEIGNDESFVFDLNYFYFKPENTALSFIVDEAAGRYPEPDRTKLIISKHYTEGQFSFDNGLYKNAIVNFGTVLEALLNVNFVRRNFFELIQDYVGGADRAKMDEIRELRNQVHANQIHLHAHIGRIEAERARNYLEIILKTI